jgi:hypothetical protein
LLGKPNNNMLGLLGFFFLFADVRPGPTSSMQAARMAACILRWTNLRAGARQAMLRAAAAALVQPRVGSTARAAVRMQRRAAVPRAAPPCECTGRKWVGKENRENNKESRKQNIRSIMEERWYL